MRDIAKNIKTLRTQKNMTQDELAEKLFVTRQTVSNYETGKSRPDVDMLVRIAEVLDTDVQTLIYGLPTPPDRKTEYIRLGIQIALTIVFWILYIQLAKIADEIRTSRYITWPNLVLYWFRGPLLVFSGWVFLQLLGVAAKLKPISGASVKWIRRGLWILLGAYLAGTLSMLLMAWVPFPRWWTQITWYLVGILPGTAGINYDYLLPGLGAGLWLCKRK